MSNRLETTIQGMATSIAPVVPALNHFAQNGGETTTDLTTFLCLGSLALTIAVLGGGIALYLRYQRNKVMDIIQTDEKRAKYADMRSQQIFTKEAAQNALNSIAARDNLAELRVLSNQLETSIKQGNVSLNQVFSDASKYHTAQEERNATSSLNPQRIQLAGKKCANDELLY